MGCHSVLSPSPIRHFELSPPEPDGEHCPSRAPHDFGNGQCAAEATSSLDHGLPEARAYAPRRFCTACKPLGLEPFGCGE